MFRFLAAFVSCLVSSPLLAAMKEMDAAAPVETVGVVWVIAFVVAFFGSIIGFFIYLWYSERKRKPEK